MDEDIRQNNSIESLTESGFKSSDLEMRTRQEPSPKSWILFFVLLGLTLFTTYKVGGYLYVVSLFLILAAHEFGHYFAGV